MTPPHNLIISPFWAGVGPFQIGTREAVWGADPLEQYGGFRAFEYEPEDRFPSSLGRSGFVEWTRYYFASQTANHTTIRVDLSIGYPTVDWNSMMLAYAWSALQFQAWVRGFVFVDGGEAQSYEVYTDNIIEFWVGRQHYFGGDFYSYRRSPIVLHLQPGQHRVDIRLVRDVRAMGGIGDPNVDVRLELRLVTDQLVVDDEHVIAPDIVDGKLPSKLISVPLRNTGKQLAVITGLASLYESWHVSSYQLLPLEIAPGQTRPLSLEISTSKVTCAHLSIHIQYLVDGEDQESSITFKYAMTQRRKAQPHKFTFLGHGGIVSFALIRSPQNKSTVPAKSNTLPVFVFLHGAGVDAESNMNSHTLDAISDLPVWTIFASGVTSWSGDDWHQWGWLDVEAAVASIPIWIENTKWEGSGVDLERWIVTGHSNGGQGVWYALTHISDKMIGAAPVSAYSSIQKYVPYVLWRGTDPQRMAVVQASMNSYRPDLLISNAYGVPVMPQHGNMDTNVPCFHSRHLYALLYQWDWMIDYQELPEKGHWFDGVMTTPALCRFYANVLTLNIEEFINTNNFTLVIANPADTGPKFGIRAEQLIDPGQLGRIEVRISEGTAELITSNVRSLSLDLSWHRCDRMIVDRQNTSAALTPLHRDSAIISRDSNGVWNPAPPLDSLGLTDRRGNQLGNLDAILRSKASFVVEHHHESLEYLALQIARNLYQYFAADVRIVKSVNENNVERTDGNVITLGMGANISRGVLSSHPIRLSASAIRIRDSVGLEREFTASQHGLAAIFLRPLEQERLEVVIWGSNIHSAATAARLFPLMTGAGQPDFIIMTQECLWKGVDGTLAMGFFDSSWNVSRSSFLS